MGKWINSYRLCKLNYYGRKNIEKSLAIQLKRLIPFMGNLYGIWNDSNDSDLGW